ncbi:DUF3322 domain-containing protein [Salinispira pacifica]|uniref:Wadjet protein JetD C-terminal domain-containing protein n=1 Tax=Salinispira pacifica TaxID=1307761 RepID=V5WKC5_9SPIO|nr:DUF3322 domain-containing protein [Salinispira pacifica]AHC15641.1 hypothetical protein L21SP2_2282 [Salinispira pacifica]
MNQELFRAIARSYESGSAFQDMYSDSVYPLQIVLKRPFPLSQIARRMDEFLRWKHEIEEDCGRFSLSLNYREEGSRAYGRQRIPESVLISDAGTHADILGRSTEYSRVRSILEQIDREAPELLRWDGENYPVLLEIAPDLDALLCVYRWRVNHPDQTPFLRELHLHGVHTKLIEKHKRVLAAWFRIGMDPEWLEQRKHFKDFPRRYGFARERRRFRFRFLHPDDSPLQGILDFEIFLHEMKDNLLKHIQNIIIIENHLSFLCLEPRNGVLAIDGMGYAAVDLVKQDWISSKTILYFGDCDAHGLDILSRLRAVRPDIISVCMSVSTFQDFFSFATIDSTPAIPLPEHLNSDEVRLFTNLHENSLKGNPNRLEQERISIQYVMSEMDLKLADPS